MEGFSFPNELPKELVEMTAQERLELAREKAKKLLKLMIDKIGVEIPEEVWPEIKLAPEDLKTSGYQSNDNIVNLQAGALNDGITYGEEIAHFIRYYLEQKNSDREIDDKDFQMAVEEFFGRLGENVARDLPLDSDLSGLFSDNERNFHGDAELYEKIKEELASSRDFIEQLKSTVEANRDSKILVVNKIKTFHSKLERAEALCDESKIKESPLKELGQQIVTIIGEGEGGGIDLIGLAKSLMKGDNYPAWAEGLFKVIDSLKVSVRRVKEVANEEEDETIVDLAVYDYLKNYVYLIKASCDYELFDLTGPNFQLLRLIREAESHLYHTVGYVAAERYMELNPDWASNLSELYQMPNQDVFDNHIQTEDLMGWLKNNEALAGLAKRIELLKEINELLYLPFDFE